MYGIEYTTFAKAIHSKDTLSSESAHRANINTSISDLTESIQEPEAESLLHKIQNLSEIPDYLEPSLYINSINSEKRKKSSIKGQYSDDFILISEFSEIEGPKPLLSIPTDGGADFNKNDYALHLMCVDFHSHTQRNENEKKFKFTTDTTIVNLWDESTQITSCIQHFTLYDIEARGFVRPFCMAYISNDQKAVEFFENIKDKFGQVTELFRRGNLVRFKQELEEKCSDLKHTRDIVEKWCDSDQLERSKIQHDFDLEDSTVLRLNQINKNTIFKSINTLLKETQDVLDITNEEMIKKNCQKTKSLFSSFNQCEKSRSFTYPLSNEENLTLNIGNYHQEQVYRPKICLHALIGSHSYAVNMALNARKEKQKNMKRLHQLCPQTVQQAINQLKLTQRYFSTSFHLLKYKKNSNNKQSLKRNLFWSITAGDCFLSDFSLDIDTQNLNKTQMDKHLANETLTKCTKPTTCTQYFSLTSQESVYLDEKCDQTVKCHSWSNLESYLDLSNEDSSLDNDEYLSVNDTDFNNQDIMYEDEYSSKKELNEYDFANSLLAIYSSSNSLAVSLSSSSVGLFYKALNSLRYQSSLADKIVQYQEFNFEDNFKTLFQKYPTSLPHLFYSILKGRPVVCVSRYCSSQAYLNSLLECLSNFVPNSFYCINSLNSSRAPKLTSSPQAHLSSDRPKLKCLHERKPIRLADLKNCKLFGLSLMIKGTCNLDSHKHYDKENIEDLLLSYIPITIRNYVSILDLDELTFSGPKYTGSYLSHTFVKCAQFNNDAFTYLFLIKNLFNFYSKLAFIYEYSYLFEQENAECESLISSGQMSFDPRKSTQSSTGSLLNLNRREKLKKLLSVKKETNLKSKFDADFEIMKKCVDHMTDREICLQKSDFKIVSYLLNSLKIKQIYLYNLAMHRKELKNMNRIKKNFANSSSVPLIELVSDSTADITEPNYSIDLSHSSDIQVPILVDFEDTHFFKK